MMYLRDDDLATANQHLREFFEAAMPEAGQPARYGGPMGGGDQQE
jgi:hypothetical protein